MVTHDEMVEVSKVDGGEKVTEGLVGDIEVGVDVDTPGEMSRGPAAELDEALVDTVREGDGDGNIAPSLFLVYNEA